MNIFAIAPRFLPHVLSMDEEISSINIDPTDMTGVIIIYVFTITYLIQKYGMFVTVKYSTHSGQWNKSYESTEQANANQKKTIFCMNFV